MKLKILWILTFLMCGFSLNASAQSGSRLCGYVAEKAPIPDTPQLSMAVVYEARKDDSSYSEQCKQAQDTIKDNLKKQDIWYAYQWKSVYKDTCESIGKLVTGPKTSDDICDQMSARCAYTVQYFGLEDTKYSKNKCK